MTWERGILQADSRLVRVVYDGARTSCLIFARRTRANSLAPYLVSGITVPDNQLFQDSELSPF